MPQTSECACNMHDLYATTATAVSQQVGDKINIHIHTHKHNTQHRTHSQTDTLMRHAKNAAHSNHLNIIKRLAESTRFISSVWGKTHSCPSSHSLSRSLSRQVD